MTTRTASDPLMNPTEVVKFLGVSLHSFHSRLWSAHMGVILKRDSLGRVIKRQRRRGFRLKPVEGPMYGKTSETLFRKSDVEKFGSHFTDRGGRVTSIRKLVRSAKPARPSQKAQARAKARVKAAPVKKAARPSQKARTRTKGTRKAARKTTRSRR